MSVLQVGDTQHEASSQQVLVQPPEARDGMRVALNAADDAASGALLLLVTSESS